MEGVDHQSGKKLQHQTGGGAFGPPLPRPPNQKPPSHPNINISVPPPSSSISYPQLYPQRLLHSPVSSSHSQSLSQPLCVSLDSLPPLNLNPPRFNSIPISTDVKLKSVMENKPSVSLNREVHNAFQGGVSVSLPPCKGHRRSKSDSPLGSSGYMQSSPSSGEGERSMWKPVKLESKAATNSGFQDDGGFVNGMKEVATTAADDLFSQYMSWENSDKMNFYGDKDLNNWTSGFQTLESNDNEVESRVDGKASGANGAISSFSKERREGFKRSLNGDIAPVSQHRRSFSLDSSIGNFHVQDGLPKFSPLNSQVGQSSPSSSMDNKASFIFLELEKAEFHAEEIKQIMKSDKLTETALTDPKRAKRILSNRQSAARSKEKKAQYVAELEQKVQTLQSERATLSTLVTKLQRDNSVLKNESKEYKLRLQATEQQSQLKENFGGESLANAITQQLALNQPMLQLQQHAIAQHLSLNQPRFQLQQQQQPNQQQRHFVMQNLPAQDKRESQSEEIQGNELHPKP